MTTPRYSYDGPVDVWVDGSCRHEAEAQLTGYVRVMEIHTTGGVIRQDGVTSWGGQLHGLGEAELFDLIGKQVELHFRDGRVGVAHLANTQGAIHGIRETPFE